MNDARSRNFAFVFYPGDSAPDDWLQLLSATHVPMYVGPLHDEKNPDDTDKKIHRHVQLFFPGKKSLSQVKNISDLVGGAAPIVVQDSVSYARYLIHKDNPEKRQYSASDVLCLNGVQEYIAYISRSADNDKLLNDIEQWIDDTGTFSYAGLMRYARSHNPEWAFVLRHKSTVHIKAYLQACQWELEKGISSKVDLSDETQ